MAGGGWQAQDAIRILRQLAERCRIYHIPFYVARIDCRKDVDILRHSWWSTVLREAHNIGAPIEAVRALWVILSNSKARANLNLPLDS